MTKPRYKTTNWKQYNQALINRGSLTFWIDEEAIQHLANDATGLKVYGEGEWKVKKHGTDEKRRVWRKLHLAVDTDTHEIMTAELSLSNVRCYLTY